MAEKQWHTVQMGAIEPHQRLQKLIADSQRVSIDSTMPINRYYRSGNQLVETADRSLREGNLEKAFTFYLRFVTIFVELILQHPGYKSVLPGDKQQTKEKIKKILPCAEEIRKKLLTKYTTEYELYVKQLKLQAEREENDRKQATTSKTQDPASTPVAPAVPVPSVPPKPSAPSHVSVISDEDAKLMDQVLYPNDFLPDKSHGSPFPAAGLLLLDGDKHFDRSLKPQPAPPAAVSMTGFRSIVVPTNTMMKFLNQSAANTGANLETCAILAGSLVRARFTITHVIFPKQSGTSDSCNTMNEEEIAVVQDRHNLITLGWIHTHPSQTAFLSSVDLHTHCSYQLMLEEAIAIVCSPKYQETGFFNLTPFGMDAISQCRQTGFHPHPSGQPLFAEAQHIILSDDVSVKVIDLR